MKILYNLGKYKLAKYMFLPRFMSEFLVFAFLRSIIVIFLDLLFFALNAQSVILIYYFDILFFDNPLYSAFYFNKNYFSKNYHS